MPFGVVCSWGAGPRPGVGVAPVALDHRWSPVIWKVSAACLCVLQPAYLF